MVGTNDPGLLVLISLASGPRHGHGIMLDIERFGGTRLGPGTLYGAIARLEADGHIEPLPTEERRRPYRLTEGGRGELTRRLAPLRRAVETAIERVAP